MGFKDFLARISRSVVTTLISIKNTSKTTENRPSASPSPTMIPNLNETGSKIVVSAAEEQVVETLRVVLDAHEAAVTSEEDIHVRMVFSDDGEMTLCHLEPIKCCTSGSPPGLPLLSTATCPSPTPTAVFSPIPSPYLSPASVSSLVVRRSGRILKADDFKPLKKCGKGGQGTVLLVEDKVTRRRAALKVIRKKDVLLRHYPNIFEEQFVMKKLAGKPGILSLLGSFHDTENFYFLTYMPNGDLLSKTDWRRKVPAADAQRYSAELVFALGVLHDNRILHRDVKQENALLDEDNHVVLADFGFAKAFGCSKAEHPWKASQFWDCDDENKNKNEHSGDFTRQKCGTRGFMAPEVYFEARYSYAADVWAAGVTLYMMLLGRFPFGIKMDQSYPELFRRAKTLPLNFEANSAVSLEAQDLLKRMLAKDPLKRATITEIKAHPYYATIDWAQMAGRDPVEDGGVDAYTNEVQRKFCPSIPAGKLYESGEDPYPWFTWVSPTLQQVPPGDRRGSATDGRRASSTAMRRVKKLLQ